MTFTGTFLDMVHHSSLLRLHPFNLRVDLKGWWFKHAVSDFWVCLPTEAGKNISSSCLYPLQAFGSVTLTFTG